MLLAPDRREPSIAGHEEQGGVSDGMGEKLKGVAKEAAGSVVGDEDLKREGEAQQAKAQEAKEAARLEEEAAEKRAQARDQELEQRRHQR